MMNGYELIAKMREVRSKYQLSHYEQALYYELVAICNQTRWKEVFLCSNARLCNALHISEKTLIKARNKLICTGLIYYVSRKRDHKPGAYSFVSPCELKNRDVFRKIPDKKTTAIETTVPEETTTANYEVDTAENAVVSTVPDPDNKKHTTDKTPPYPPNNLSVSERMSSVYRRYRLSQKYIVLYTKVYSSVHKSIYSCIQKYIVPGRIKKYRAARKIKKLPDSYRDI